jgi:hypothetical protein
MLFNADDLHDLAQRLSGEHGSLSSSNLVNYGQTVILRPGSRTSMGVLLSGGAVGELLGEDYEVFPATLTYKSDVSSDGIDRLPMELVELDNELDRLDDADEQFGAQGERVRKRYMRIVGRFRRYVVKARQSKKPGARRRAAALFRRIRRIYRKMQDRGIETKGLPRPGQIAKQASHMVRENSKSPTPMAPYAVTPLELPAPPPAFGVEQAEADTELAADARAEVGGYLFGREEHDYFGVHEDMVPSEYAAISSEADRLGSQIDGEDGFGDDFGVGGDNIRSRYERLANRYRRFAAKSYRKGTPRLRARAEKLLSKIRKIYLQMQEKGLEVEGLTTPEELADEAGDFVMEAEVTSRATPVGNKRAGKRSSKRSRQDDDEDGDKRSSKRSRRDDDEDGGRDPFEDPDDEMGLFGVESTPFDIVDEKEEIVFGALERAIEEARFALGLDEDLSGDDDDDLDLLGGDDDLDLLGGDDDPSGDDNDLPSDDSDLLGGDDDEDDDAEFKAFLEGEEDEDDFGDEDEDGDDDEDDFGDEDEDEDGDEDEERGLRKHGTIEDASRDDVRESRAEARAAATSRRAAKSERDAARLDLQRLRAERKADKISGDDEDEGEDEDEDEDVKPSKSKSKSKAKGEDEDVKSSKSKSKGKGKAEAEDGEDEISDEESDDTVAVQRSKLSKAAKQASALLADPKSTEIVSDLSSALRDAKRLLSTMNIRLKKGSKNGGIDYGRLRPVPRGGVSGGITVVAMRRRARSPQAAKIQAYAASFGMESNGHILDVYATDFLDRSGGYDGLESLEAIQSATGPNDYLYGENESDFGSDAMGRMFRTRGRDLRGNMPSMRSGRLLQVAANPYRSRSSRHAAMKELRARYGAQEQAAESQAEEIGYLFVTRGRELMDEMPELRSYRLYNIFSNPRRSERVRREALQTLAARYAEDNFGEDYGRMFRVRGRRAMALAPQANSAKLLQVASNPYRSGPVRAAAAAELADRHAVKQGLPAPVEVVPDPVAPQIVVQPTPITPATAPVTASLAAPAPAYVPVANPAFAQPVPPPAPVSTQPSPSYFQDQQALEREVAASLPSYYAYDGSMNAQPFPFGEEAPLPPPRRSGPEVFA